MPREAKPSILIPTEEPDDLVQLMGQSTRPLVPKNNSQGSMNGGSPFGEGMSPDHNELPSGLPPPIKQHKMVLGPSAGLGIG